MSEVFLKILNMSFVASWLILAVILLRLALKQAPKWITCLLWGMVAVRLLCPMSFESSLSLIPNAEPITQEILMTEPPDIHEAPVFDPVVNPNLPDVAPITPDTSIDQVQIKTMLAAFAWAIGMGVMLAYATASYLRLRYKVRASLHLRDNIWLCDEIATPFLLGVFRPKIYIPSGINESSLSPIIAHENAHLKRRDHWWKPLGFLILSIHWFNPLVWAAYILLCRDIELACDEKVIRSLGKEESIAYSEALLSCSVSRRTILVCPLAFGEVGVKERVKRVLNYKKPAFWIVVVAALTSVVLAVCFLTDPHSFPVDLASIQISEASTLDLRTSSGPTIHQLSNAETEELSGRLKDLKVRQKDQDLQGQTPFYSLYVDTMEQGRITFCGFNNDGTNIAVLYDNVYYRITNSDFARYLQNICAGGTRVEAEEQVTPLVNDLDRAISAALADHYVPDKPDGLIHVESYNILFQRELCGVPKAGQDQDAKSVTVYLLVLHESFRPDSDPTQPIEGVGGDYIPTALTFRLSDGKYFLEEYWEPRDGGYYTDDIKAKFPEAAEQQVWNDQEIILELQQSNQAEIHRILQEQGSFEDLAGELLDLP